MVNNEAELQQEADEVRKNIAAYINRITQNTAMDDAVSYYRLCDIITSGRMLH